MSFVLTPGEPSGIGPDLVIQMAAHAEFAALLHDVIVVADANLMQERAAYLNVPCDLPIQHIPLRVPCTPGIPNRANAEYVMETITRATQGCLSGFFDALVTGPVDKGIINQAGIPFRGHTEFLAKLTGCPHPVMMLMTEKLRVALATTHVPLSEVPSALTPECLETTLRVLHQGLHEQLGISEPQIYVCGLNPHAGDSGALGREEIEIITPVLTKLRQEGFQLKGPLAADTAFLFDPHQSPDVVLAMYHDQGLPVLKYAGFGRAVNITLGLPILRTSVDHGTAYDLVGKGTADMGSLVTAIECIVSLRKKSHESS